MWIVPPNHITLDIETVNADPAEAEAAMRRAWTPDARWQPATIGQRYLDALARKQQQLALLDTSPIISVALRTEADCRLIHWMPVPDVSIVGVPLERADDETAMLRRVIAYLDAVGPETILVGHNLRRFDLPRLRLAMVRAGLRLPPCLANPEHPTYDTMSMWKFFCLDERPMISLDECLELAGLSSHKPTVSGADVPALYQAGEYATIAAYAIADVLAQDVLYLRMSGQADGAPVVPTTTAARPAPATTGPGTSTDDVSRLLSQFLPETNP